MPAGAAIGGVLGAAGGYFNSRSQKRTAAAQQQAIQNAAAMMSGGNVMGRAQTYNPFIVNALMNPNAPSPNNPFMAQMRNLAANPGYIDPALMNLPLTQAARGQQQGLMAAQSQLGRSGMEGGMGDAYALASQAALTGQRANIMQQYSLWREQQRRSDIDWLMNQYSNAIGQAQQGQGMQAGIYGQLPQYMQANSTTGNMITGALAGMGSMMGLGGMMGGAGAQAAGQAAQGIGAGAGRGIGAGIGTGMAGVFGQQGGFGSMPPSVGAGTGNLGMAPQGWGQNLFTQRQG